MRGKVRRKISMRFVTGWNKCRKYRNSPALFILCGAGFCTKKESTPKSKAFCNYVGVEYKPSHTCRRSYVTNCLDKGMKLALQTMKQTLCKITKNAEAPENASSAFPEASLGEEYLPKGRISI